MDQLTSFAVYASWNITGEEQVWESGGWKKPKKRSLSEGCFFDFLPGRWEIGARYSNADIDRDLFIYDYTFYGQSTQEVRTFSLNLHWQPRDQMRFSVQWVKTIADQDLVTFGDTDRDSSFLLRWELLID
jgi:phosphate-selective porin